MSGYVDEILAREANKDLNPQEIHDALGAHYQRMQKFVEGVAKNKWHLIQKQNIQLYLKNSV